MPTQNMNSRTREGQTDERWFFCETVTDGTGDPVLIPSIGREVSIAVAPGTSARVEFTLSDYDAIESGTAIWYGWPDGDVTEVTTNAIAGGVSALRLVSVGASAWEIAV